MLVAVAIVAVVVAVVVSAAIAVAAVAVYSRKQPSSSGRFVYAGQKMLLDGCSYVVQDSQFPFVFLLCQLSLWV